MYTAEELIWATQLAYCNFDQMEYERVCSVGNALLNLYILEHNIEN